jgi:hypothetical protein
MQELNPLSRDSKIPNDEPSDVATGMPKAFRQSKSDGIDQLCKNDGVVAVNWRTAIVAGKP